MRRMLLLVGWLVVFIALGFTPSLVEGAEGEEPRQLSKKEEKKRLKQLQDELRGPFRKWMREDVRYILTAEERKAFVRLTTDEERENFIEQFWLRRDPTPDTQENEYREEHYRRIAYSNERVRIRHSRLEDRPAAASTSPSVLPTRSNHTPPEACTRDLMKKAAE